MLNILVCVKQVPDINLVKMDSMSHLPTEVG